MSAAPIAVVLVEDDRSVCQRIERLLAGSSEVVLAAVFHDAETAHDRLLVERVAAEVVVVDLVLPGMNGIELIRRLGAGRAELETIVLTTVEDDETVFEALEAGASGYLVKTAGLDALRDGLMVLLRGGAPMTPTIARRLLEGFRGARGATDARAPAPSDPGPLTAREIEVLVRLAQGASYGSIGKDLGIGTGTVQSHIKAIYRKLGIHSRSEATREVYRRRLRP